MSTPSTTIVPFASLPSCAVDCGALYDANGACVPPVNPSTDESNWDACFCAYSSLQPLKSGPNDVCRGSCNADAQGLSSIQSWFTNLCNQQAAPTNTGTTSATSSSTPGSGNSGNGRGGDWASTHVNWIVFIVVVVVGIIGIWVGACIWRRKYLKKKDRLYELGKGLPSTVAVNTQGNIVADARDSTILTGPGLFMSGTGVNDVGALQPEKPRSKFGRRS